MADFFRGLSGGFQTGLQLGAQLRQRRQEEELAKAYGLAPQEQQAPLATPEQIGRAQAETQALAAQDAEMFGLAPQEMQRYAPAMPQEGARTGMSTYRLGEQVLQRAPTQAEIDAARTRAAADVYGRYGDTARREELLRGLRAEQRAQTAEERAAQQFETQQRTAGLTQQQLQQQIAAGGRTAAAAERMDAFTQWAQQNPDQSRDFAAVSAKARELRMTPDEQFKVASNLTGIDEAEFKASQSRIRKLVANQGLDGLLKAHRDSNDLDPGSHFEQVRGKDGTITLNRVDTATGRVIQPNVFSGKEAEVVGYLNKAAMDPATIVDYTMNLRKAQAALEASQATAEAQRGLGRLYEARRTTELGKAGADVRQQDYNDRANALIEGYQAAMALGPQGRQAAAIYAQEYDQLRATTPRGLTRAPALAALNAAQRAEKPEKPVDVPEAGKRVTIGGRLMQTDGYGGYVSAKGVLPDEQATVLKKAGIPDNYASRIMWNNDSDAVMFNGKEYNPLDKRDMNELKDDLKAFDVMNQRIAEEARMRANPPAPSGFQGARTTGLGPATTYGVRPGAESIYGR